LLFVQPYHDVADHRHDRPECAIWDFETPTPGAQSRVWEMPERVDHHFDLPGTEGFRYEFVGISASENYPDEWGAVFNVYSPTGSLMDGPAVLAVEGATGRVSGSPLSRED
jgi:hypothetical protein